VRHHSFHQSSQADPFLSLQLADFFVLWLMPNRNEGPCYFVFMSIMFVIIVGSQLFWMCRIGKVGKKLISRKSWRTGLAVAGLLVYIFLLAFNLFSGINRGSSWNFRAELLEAPFEIWFVGSVLGFFVIMLLWNVDRLARVVIEIAPSRRRFLEHRAITLSAAPFVAGAYGLFYGRLNLETTRQRIRLQRLPKAFEGFRIVQLPIFTSAPS
jgi:hypothetical protein